MGDCSRQRGTLEKALCCLMAVRACGTTKSPHEVEESLSARACQSQDEELELL